MNDYQTAISILERVWETAKRSNQEQPDFNFIRQCVEELPVYLTNWNERGNLVLDWKDIVESVMDGVSCKYFENLSQDDCNRITEIYSPRKDDTM